MVISRQTWNRFGLMLLTHKRFVGVASTHRRDTSIYQTPVVFTSVQNVGETSNYYLFSVRVHLPNPKQLFCCFQSLPTQTSVFADSYGNVLYNLYLLTYLVLTYLVQMFVSWQCLIYPGLVGQAPKSGTTRTKDLQGEHPRQSSNLGYELNQSKESQGTNIRKLNQSIQNLYPSKQLEGRSFLPMAVVSSHVGFDHRS